MILNFSSILKAIYRLILERKDSVYFKNIEYSRKHYPRDLEELKKLNIEQI